MAPHNRTFGILKPLGGGDPIPLKKEELTVGRRPTNDIRLDFENVSGKHCSLRYINGTWHVRDLNSTNGTTVNGQKVASEHTLLPTDELGVASHLFRIDYEANTTIAESYQVLEEQMAGDSPRRKSLMELAGLDDDNKPKRRARPTEQPKQTIARPAADEADFDDALPDVFDAKPKRRPEDDTDNFLKIFEEDGNPSR
jgi:pSer/pThr/pTyr-binding forkhead associated (FHA) protein